MKSIYLFLAILILAISGYSQNYMSTLTYTISVPFKDSKEFVEKTSYLGIGFDGRKFLNQGISVGGYIGWQVLYEKAFNTIEIPKGAVTGTQFRHINSIPIMLNAHLYPGGSDCFRPFVGLNAGGYYVWQRFEMGVIVLEDRQWQWGFAPEAGFVVPIGDLRINLSGKLNYGVPAASSNIYEDPKALTYVTFHIGFVYYRK